MILSNIDLHLTGYSDPIWSQSTHWCVHTFTHHHSSSVTPLLISLCVKEPLPERVHGVEVRVSLSIKEPLPGRVHGVEIRVSLESLPGCVHGVEVRVSLEEFSTNQVTDGRPNDRHGIKHTCKTNGYSLLSKKKPTEFNQQDLNIQ